ncbi:MAG TPA: hemolysin III family protein, partial [Ilumatobacter sp.]|nr:hemolysin III family protein [Ilumatobacter sp.]
QASSSADTDRPIEPTTLGGTLHALNMRFGVGDGNDVALGHVLRPTWRGRVHVIGLLVAVPAVIALLLNSTGDARFRVGLTVYAVGLCSMLGASATYHRWVHGLRARCAWRRVDHAAIFAAIAGSSTPIVVAALPGARGFVLVGAVWSAALLGAWCKLSRWAGGDRAGTKMYVVTIALGAVAVPWLWARHGIGPAALVVSGGVAYLVGAACFATRWPTLRPTVFSYHEVWHVFTLIAAVAQFVAIWMLAT